VCVEGLRRYLQMSEARSPGDRTQQRDIACLLSTYTRQYPPLRTDPEDGTECPFIELGFVDYFRESGTYRLNMTDITTLPPEVLCYALAKKLNAAHEPEKSVEISVSEAASQECSPGRVLRLNPEKLHDAALQARMQLDKGFITVLSLAGERVIKLQSLSELEWAKLFYNRKPCEKAHAA